MVIWTVAATAAFGFSLAALVKHQGNSLLTQAGSAVAGGVSWVVLIAASIAFGSLTLYQLMLLATSGQTIGKRFFGIRIVDLEGKPAGLIQALLLRALVFNFLVSVVIGFSSAIIPFAGLVLMFLDYATAFGEERRCIHDYFAGTQVRWVRIVEIKTLRIFAVGSGVALAGAGVFAGMNQEALLGAFKAPPPAIAAAPVPAPAPAPLPVPTPVVAVVAPVPVPEPTTAPAPEAEKKIYQFTDKQGVVHVTDDASKVPPEFRR